MWQAYVRFQESPDGDRTLRDADHRVRFRNAVLTWAATASAALVLNIISGVEFWAWPIWVADGTWALSVKVDGSLMQREGFLAPEPEA